MSVTFKETAMPPYPWHGSLWSKFCEKRNSKRMPHALLLTGAEGVGADALSYSMARYLLCHAPLEDVACGHCRGCELFQAETHPDFFILKAEEDSTQIKVDMVRRCVDFVAKTPHYQSGKVVIVERAEQMNVNAANALLKSLEEPIGQTVFILVTAQASAILPTIRSRCQQVIVAVPAPMIALEWLEAHEVESAQKWLSQAGGAPILAKERAQGDFAEQQQIVFSSAEHLLNGSAGALTVAGQWQKIEIDRLIIMQLSILEAVIKAKMAEKTMDRELVTISNYLSGVNESYLFRLREKLLSKLAQWRSNRNLNSVMMCEEMAMDWHSLAHLARRASSAS